jgi:hypothetical protein
MDNCLEKDVLVDVLKLIDLKVNSPEIAEGKRFEKVNDYIDKTIIEIEQEIASLPNTHEQNWDKLNKIFIDLVKEN